MVYHKALFIAAAIERIQVFLFNAISYPHLNFHRCAHVITSVSILNAINLCVCALFTTKLQPMS